MNTKLLRQKVLDLAIHGKLIPQNPEHESATELLKRIRGESLPLSPDGKPSSATPSPRGKAPKTPSTPISEDELPFEIPENWCWCRLPEVCSMPIKDGTHQTPTYSDKENGIPFLSSKDVTSGKIDWSNIKYITKELHEELYKRIAPQVDDILLAKNGTTGIAAIVEDEIVFDIYVTLAVLRPTQELIYPKYLLNIVNSSFCKNQFNAHLTGIGVPNLHLTDINKTIIPLPPLEEQKLIVEEIERIFALIDTVEQNKTDLETVIKQTKSKILDLAIHGKLVPQDKADEPASVLFEKIKEEKQLKKVDEIEEVPFEIPSSWKWVHLSDVCLKLKRGKSPKYVEKSNYMAFAQKCNQKDGPTSLEKALYIDETSLNRYPPEEYMQKYDTVINSTGTGTLGRVGIYDCEVPEGIKGVFADSHVTTIHPSSYMNPKYIYYFVKCKQKYLESAGEGSTNQKELKVNTIGEMEFPLPPLEEQNRIVLKIESFFSLSSMS